MNTKQSDMRWTFPVLALGIVLIILLSACVRNTPTNNNQNIVISIEVATETAVDEGLRFLEKENPESTDWMITQLRVVLL